MWFWTSKWGSSQHYPASSARTGYSLPSQIWHGKDCCFRDINSEPNDTLRLKLRASSMHRHLPHKGTSPSNLQGLQETRFKFKLIQVVISKNHNWDVRHFLEVSLLKTILLISKIQTKILISLSLLREGFWTWLGIKPLTMKRYTNNLNLV